MQAHNLKRQTKRITSLDVGRGGKRGKTSGRGTKGQNARAGRKFRPVMRDTIKKLPKLRGYRFNSITTKPVAINLSQLSVFTKGEMVTPKTLVEKKVVELVLGKLPKVKILATGELAQVLNFEGCFISESAVSKIEKAGGKVTKVEMPESQAKAIAKNEAKKAAKKKKK